MVHFDAEYMLESMVEDLYANDKDGSGDLSQKEFKKIIRSGQLLAGHRARLRPVLLASHGILP